MAKAITLQRRSHGYFFDFVFLALLRGFRSAGSIQCFAYYVLGLVVTEADRIAVLAVSGVISSLEKVIHLEKVIPFKERGFVP